MFAVGMRVVVVKPQDDAPGFMKEGLMGTVDKVFDNGNAAVIFDGRNDPTTAYKNEIMPSAMENE